MSQDPQGYFWTRNSNGSIKRPDLIQRFSRNWSEINGRTTSNPSGSSHCYGMISRLDLKLSSVTPDTSGMCSWPRCWTNPSRNFLNHPLGLIWCSFMNGNQWSPEDERSLHSTPIFIWVLYMTLWTTSGVETTWFTRRCLRGARNSSRSLERGTGVWWSNPGSGNLQPSSSQMRCFTSRQFRPLKGYAHGRVVVILFGIL